MPSYSVAQAKNELPRLINRAEQGEDVVITRRGVPVATINATRTDRRAVADDIFERLRTLRESGPVLPMTAVQLVNDMYEDDL